MAALGWLLNLGFAGTAGEDVDLDDEGFLGFLPQRTFQAAVRPRTIEATQRMRSFSGSMKPGGRETKH